MVGIIIPFEQNEIGRQIWSNGILDNRNHHLRHIHELTTTSVTENSSIREDLEWYGFDQNAPSPSDNGLSTVEVDNVVCPLLPQQEQLLLTIDPLADSNVFGIDIFVQARKLVTLKVLNFAGIKFRDFREF